ncbi:MAG: TolC family protein [Fuerstiella sp.]
MTRRKTTQNPLRRTGVWVHRLIIWQVTFSVVFAPMLFTGCASSARQWEKTVGNDTCDIDCITSQIDTPAPRIVQEVSMTSEPVTALTIAESEVVYYEMTLDEVLRRAMEHSTVLRDIGGVVLRSPDSVNTGFAMQTQETDPRFGMEAALSAFDAQLAASATFNNNNRIFNNSFFAGGATAFTQDLHDYQVELSKRSATGSLLAIRGVTDYDANNAPANTFRSSWDTWLEGEIRQPLLQGGGLEFNRIAGPGATPGVYNGVLIAKANADINHAEFITSLRDFVSNVENAYWDLYLAYRELDARKKAMERALVQWNEAKQRKNAGTFELGEEALARQQYYQLKADVDEALSGRLLQGTQTRNGSSGGTVQMAGGVLTAERRLRLMIGLAAADGQLIRPSEEPTMADIHFDWHSCMNESIRQRPELQRQHVAVKKREMELLAARNFLNPRLDAVGRYRWRGFGDDFIGSGTQTGTSPASALGNLATGQQQEWTLGVELTVPIGYRRAHAAVQNAELILARERAIQKEQQREVVSDLSGAIADAVRAYQSVQNNLNQYLAAKDYLTDLETRRKAQQRDGVDRILDAQRRVLQSEIQFFRARAEYAVALKNVHYEKGSLLRYKDLRIAGMPTQGDYPFEVAPPTEEPLAEPVNEPLEEPLPMTDAARVNVVSEGYASSTADAAISSETAVPPTPVATAATATVPTPPTSLTSSDADSGETIPLPPADVTQTATVPAVPVAVEQRHEWTATIREANADPTTAFVSTAPASPSSLIPEPTVTPEPAATPESFDGSAPFAPPQTSPVPSSPVPSSPAPSSPAPLPFAIPSSAEPSSSPGATFGPAATFGAPARAESAADTSEPTAAPETTTAIRQNSAVRATTGFSSVPEPTQSMSHPLRPREPGRTSLLSENASRTSAQKLNGGRLSPVTCKPTSASGQHRVATISHTTKAAAKPQTATTSVIPGGTSPVRSSRLMPATISDPEPGSTTPIPGAIIEAGPVTPIR